MDVDVVIQDNFVPHVLSHYKEGKVDCVMQDSETDNCCTGFFSMAPSVRTLALDKSFYTSRGSERFTTNQNFFHHHVTKKGLLLLRRLPKDLYPVGKHYYDNYSRIDRLCKIIHFNCLRGHDVKVEAMKRYGKWCI